MNNIIIFFAEYLGYVLLAFLAVWFLYEIFKKQVRARIFLLQLTIAIILSRGIVTEGIRFFWHRARPFVEYNFSPIVEHVASPSFPSGHATFFFALGTVIYFYNKKAGIVFLLGSTFVVIARVLAGLHWPSDIIAGAAIGIVSGLFVIQSSRRFLKKNSG